MCWSTTPRTRLPLRADRTVHGSASSQSSSLPPRAIWSQRRLPDDPESHFPDFVNEVMKLATPPTTFRNVLIIVEVKNSQHWQTGIGVLQRQIYLTLPLQALHTQRCTYWRYGKKDDDEQDPQRLINCHHTTHDQASFDGLQVLAGLVAAL